MAKREPFYHRTLFWGCASGALAIVTTVIGVMVKDVRWLLWLALPLMGVSAYEVARTWFIVKISTIVTIVVIIVCAGGLGWLYYYISPDKTVDVIPNVVLVAESGRLTLYNHGQNDLQLWGDKVEGTPAAIEKKSLLVPKDGYYYLFDDGLKSFILRNVGQEGEKFLTFDIYLSDQWGQHFTANCRVLGKVHEGKVYLHAQNLGISRGGWD